MEINRVGLCSHSVHPRRQTMEETNKDPNFMAQADIDKKLEEKFKAANQKLEEIQKVLEVGSASIVCNDIL